jgi:hypothetical protein
MKKSGAASGGECVQYRTKRDRRQTQARFTA